MIVAAKGTKIQHDVITNPSGIETHAYTSIAQVMTITPPPLMMGTKENTNLDDSCKQTDGTIPDPGETAMHIQFDPAGATHALLVTLFASGSHEPWRILFNDQGIGTSASSTAWIGWVKGLVIGEINVEGNVEADVTIQNTSVPIFTPRA